MNDSIFMQNRLFIMTIMTKATYFIFLLNFRHNSLVSSMPLNLLEWIDIVNDNKERRGSKLRPYLFSVDSFD
jgi:hypothetical protein